MLASGFRTIDASSWLTASASPPVYTNVLLHCPPLPQCLDARAYAPSRITAASNSAHQARCKHLHNCKLRADAYRTPKHERSNKNATSNSQRSLGFLLAIRSASGPLAPHPQRAARSPAPREQRPTDRMPGPRLARQNARRLRSRSKAPTSTASC